MGIHEKLGIIQAELKAPKSQYNSFGKYKYRNCEDVLEAVKPLLSANGCTLTISDEIDMIGNRFYIKSTVTLTEIKSNESISVSASAREEESKKGMDGSQVTGAASSYARKYALNGLFCIDDNKDSDTTNTGGKEKADPAPNKPEPPKEYKCHDCGKPFQGFTDKNGKQWNAGQVYHMSENKNADKIARCSECMKKLTNGGNK